MLCTETLHFILYFIIYAFVSGTYDNDTSRSAACQGAMRVGSDPREAVPDVTRRSRAQPTHRLTAPRPTHHHHQHHHTREARTKHALFLALINCQLINGRFNLKSLSKKRVLSVDAALTRATFYLPTNDSVRR